MPVRDAALPIVQQYNIATATQATALTECPKGHGRWLTFESGAPEREWTLICPFCGEEKKIVLPDIGKADPA